ncbi:MAG TPA: endo-1,4-beta-xylanase, partial [Cyclobacteriaceae bacterium]|nr:endo-1,4-beta-xylanase [Cyclobacteriaceae bacterium]
MKYIIYLPMKIIPVLFIAVAFLIFISPAVSGQDGDIDKSITLVRKGEIVVKSKPGSEIIVEQLRHEFWFGCAISDGIFNGRASAEDVKQYKEKFLENFNSAVTENAVKWGSMERTKGQVNYSVIDAMLAWTEENHFPLRGHNLFWGIPQFVQPWVKELSDEE